MNWQPGCQAADRGRSDYYRALGVSSSASDADIAKAYRRLALKYHPDKNPDRSAEACEAFQAITEAYAELSDPRRRSQYDRQRQSTLFPFRGCFCVGTDACSQGAAAAFPGEPSQTTCGATEGSATSFFFRYLSCLGGIAGLSGTPATACGATEWTGSSSWGACPVDPCDSGMSRRDSGKHKEDSGKHKERDAIVLPAGVFVSVRGCAADPEANGKVGKVLRFEDTLSRYEVLLKGGRMMLSPRNLTQQCEIEVTGVAEKPELNGEFGDVVTHDDDAGRYIVRMRNQDLTASLARRNCILNEGTCVSLCGLAEDQYNGRVVRIVMVDKDAGRYFVRCQTGENVKVKFDNVIC